MLLTDWWSVNDLVTVEPVAPVNSHNLTATRSSQWPLLLHHDNLARLLRAKWEDPTPSQHLPNPVILPFITPCYLWFLSARLDTPFLTSFFLKSPCRSAKYNISFPTGFRRTRKKALLNIFLPPWNQSRLTYDSNGKLRTLKWKQYKFSAHFYLLLEVSSSFWTPRRSGLTHIIFHTAWDCISLASCCWPDVQERIVAKCCWEIKIRQTWPQCHRYHRSPSSVD